MPKYEKTSATVIGGRIGMGMGGDGRMSYMPYISYCYQVNGQEYINERFTQNGVGRRMQGAVQKIVDKYPVNSTIEIFYNVANPQDAFIQKGFGGSVNRMLYIMLFGSLLILALALWFGHSQGLIDWFGAV